MPRQPIAALCCDRSPVVVRASGNEARHLGGLVCVVTEVVVTSEEHLRSSILGVNTHEIVSVQVAQEAFGSSAEYPKTVPGVVSMFPVAVADAAASEGQQNFGVFNSFDITVYIEKHHRGSQRMLPSPCLSCPCCR